MGGFLFSFIIKLSPKGAPQKAMVFVAETMSTNYRNPGNARGVKPTVADTSLLLHTHTHTLNIVKSQKRNKQKHTFGLIFNWALNGA